MKGNNIIEDDYVSNSLLEYIHQDVEKRKQENNHTLMQMKNKSFKNRTLCGFLHIINLHHNH